MAQSRKLGTLQRVDLRAFWVDEAREQDHVLMLAVEPVGEMDGATTATMVFLGGFDPRGSAFLYPFRGV